MELELAGRDARTLPEGVAVRYRADAYYSQRSVDAVIVKVDEKKERVRGVRVSLL